MAELLLRDVSEETVRRLERRAEAHGRSVEAEHMAIVEEAVQAETPPGGEFRTTQGTISGLEGATWLADLDPDELRDRHDMGREAYLSLEELENVAEAFRRLR